MGRGKLRQFQHVNRRQLLSRCREYSCLNDVSYPWKLIGSASVSAASFGKSGVDISTPPIHSVATPWVKWGGHIYPYPLRRDALGEAPVQTPWHNAPRFIRFLRYINCLFTWLSSFLSLFFLYVLCFFLTYLLPYSLTFWLIYSFQPGRMS